MKTATVTDVCSITVLDCNVTLMQQSEAWVASFIALSFLVIILTSDIVWSDSLLCITTKISWMGRKNLKYFSLYVKS